MLGISHLENNCKIRKEDSLGMRSEEAQHLKIRENEITQQEYLEEVAREVGRKSGKSGIREDSASNRKEGSSVPSVAKRLRKLRTKQFLLSLAPTGGPGHPHKSLWGRQVGTQGRLK